MTKVIEERHIRPLSSRICFYALTNSSIESGAIGSGLCSFLNLVVLLKFGNRGNSIDDKAASGTRATLRKYCTRQKGFPR